MERAMARSRQASLFGDETMVAADGHGGTAAAMEPARPSAQARAAGKGASKAGGKDGAGGPKSARTPPRIKPAHQDDTPLIPAAAAGSAADGADDDGDDSDGAAKGGKGKGAKGKHRTKAHEMAEKQREISVSEFFAKNRHLLGFDSKRKALLTAVKEAVDNALDACEEAEILPTLSVVIEPVKGEEDRFRISVGDNGPGIVNEQIDNVFAKLLYGSKFHRLRQSRGQQGIGISAAAMYGQMTTGVPTQIKTRIGKGHDAIDVALRIDTAKNMPVRPRPPRVFDWDRDHGTEVTIELEAKYQKGRGSVDEYLAQTAIANPHVQMSYKAPDATEPVVFERATKSLPDQPKEIKPHPHGVELGFLMKMMKSTSATRLSSFLQHDFSRVSSRIAKEICAKAGLEPETRVKSLEHKSAEALYKAIAQTKIGRA